ncbi:MAG TPA: DUF1566 domain-containing protein [bacterium]|nr:DUF1566 domain-containing protein [bacterium]
MSRFFLKGVFSIVMIIILFSCNENNSSKQNGDSLVDNSLFDADELFFDDADFFDDKIDEDAYFATDSDSNSDYFENENSDDSDNDKYINDDNSKNDDDFSLGEIEWTDPETNYMWSTKNNQEMHWYNAVIYCEDLIISGYDDWHLPTIGQLRTLIRNCEGTVIGGGCKINDMCLDYNCICSDDNCNEYGPCSCGSSQTTEYSVLGDRQEMWSSSEITSSTPEWIIPEENAWVVNFEKASLDYGSSPKGNYHSVRCVRNTPELVCGDGYAGYGEECDYGENNGKTECVYGKEYCVLCDNDCKRFSGETAYCGDNIKNGEEECDGDGDCTPDCKVTFCGDGFKGESEYCDDGENNGKGEGYCNVACTDFVPWVDADTGYYWSSTFLNKGWHEAVDYCESLVEGSFSDWHLPTISEMRTMVTSDCSTLKIDGTCLVTNDCASYSDCFVNCSKCYSCSGICGCHIFSKMGFTDTLWSFSDQMDNKLKAWNLSFCNGEIKSTYKTDNINFKCVRNTPEALCGDGKISYGENCDDGFEYNGKNGYCKSDCTGMVEYCGDGIINGSEICDDGESNGKKGFCSTECNDAVWTDPATGYSWSRKAYFNQTDALNYCESLSEGGYNNWKLPTISELRTIIQNCNNTITGGPCGVSDNCLKMPYGICETVECNGCESNNHGIYSVFEETEQFWSSSFTVGDVDFAWYINFKDGSITYSNVSNKKYIRCISFDDCNPNDEKIITCATDPEKKQKQVCDLSRNWGNEGECVYCFEDQTRMVTCLSDSEKWQKQICNETGEWIDEGECEICAENDKKAVVCESDNEKWQKQVCNSVGQWINDGICYGPYGSSLEINVTVDYIVTNESSLTDDMVSFSPFISGTFGSIGEIPPEITVDPKIYHFGQVDSYSNFSVTQHSLSGSDKKNPQAMIMISTENVVSGSAKVGLANDDEIFLSVFDVNGSGVECYHGFGVGTVNISDSNLTPGVDGKVTITGYIDLWHPTEYKDMGDISGSLGTMKSCSKL